VPAANPRSGAAAPPSSSP